MERAGQPEGEAACVEEVVACQALDDGGILAVFETLAADEAVCIALVGLERIMLPLHRLQARDKAAHAAMLLVHIGQRKDQRGGLQGESECHRGADTGLDKFEGDKGGVVEEAHGVVHGCYAALLLLKPPGVLLRPMVVAAQGVLGHQAPEQRWEAHCIDGHRMPHRTSPHEEVQDRPDKRNVGHEEHIERQDGGEVVRERMDGALLARNPSYPPGLPVVHHLQTEGERQDAGQWVWKHTASVQQNQRAL